MALTLLPRRRRDEVVEQPRTEPRGRFPAVSYAVVYATFLLIIPSQLIIRQLGAPGTPANIWAVGALLWWACASLGGQNRAGYSPVRLGVLVLTVCVVASYAWASASGWWVPLSVRESTSDITSLVTPTVAEVTRAMSTAAGRGLLSFGAWMGITLVIADGMRSWLDLAKLVEWLCWLGSAVAWVGIVQFFTPIDLVRYIQVPGLVANTDIAGVQARSVLNRVQGTAIHPIEFGVVMAALLPLAIHYAMHSTRDRRAWVPAILIGVALPLSVSRSAILAGGIAFAVLLMGWSSKTRIRALVILPIAIVALRVLIPGLVGTIRSLFTNLFNDPSIQGRTDDYSTVFAVFGDHIWLGRGLFTFIPKYYRILDNQYLGALLELGIIGLTAVIIFFVLGYFSARGARRRTTNPVGRDLSLSLSASIAGLVISYATFDAWSFPMAAGITFVLIGMAGAAWRLARLDNPTGAPTEVSHHGH